MKKLTTLFQIIIIGLLLVIAFKPQSAPVVDRGVQYASLKAQAREPIQYAEGEQIEHLCNTRFRAVAISPNRIVLECVVGSTRTPTPTSTLPVTDSPSPTMPHDTATPSGDLQAWHTPGSHDGLNAHEHGDAPPDWANQFSMANFGHPVMYGGDERSSDTENTMKHQSFKGVAYRVNGNSACPIDLYFRYHAASNPMDRASAFHSYELYMKDCQGGVSFRQGVYWVGYPEFRSQRMSRFNELAGTLLPDGSVAPGRDQFIVAAPDRADFARGNKCEQWYAFAGKHGGEYSITICQATVYFEYDEHLGDFMNMDTWDLTGGLGLSRRFEVSLYGINSPVPFRQPAGWFCASRFPTEDRRESTRRPNGSISFVRPTWSVITNGVNSPDDCADGYLPQFTASTFPSTGIYAGLNNTLPLKPFPGAGIVEVPN